MRTRLGLAAGLLACVLNVQAQPSLEQLADQPYWLSLGHYEHAKLGGWRSYVDDARFFLSPQGARSPLAELKATVAQLRQPASLANQHVLCRYPARSRWLIEQLQLKALPQPQCSEFRAWYKDINPDSATLVFPAAYLNSPSSMFGHTLLRIDPAGSANSGTALLSYAVNFGAYIEGSDNSILYAWKGLMGGYPGLFAVLPYREKITEYSKLENRDLWEYRLNLSSEETGRLIEHLWELKQVRFDYFFFDENCSYRLLELLQVARPNLQLTEQFPLTAIPADTVRAVKQSGSVERIDYRPSKEKELLARSQTLTADEQAWLLRLAEDDRILNNAEFLALPAPRRALVVDGAYRLLRYRVSASERDGQAAARSYQLLKAINDNPPPALHLLRPALPEEGHDSRTWQLAAGSREGRAFAEYGLRMAYHDLQDNLEGFPLGAQIEILGLKLRQYQGNQWQLQELKLAGIRSLTPRSALIKPLSWQVAGGFERVPGKESEYRLASYLGGGAGGSWQLSSSGLGYLLATTRIEHQRDFAPFIEPAVGFDAGLLWRTALGNAQLEAKGDYFAGGEVRRALALSQQWESSTNLGLRLSWQRSFSHLAGNDNELSLQLRWYHY